MIVKPSLQLYKNTIVTCLTLDGEPDVVRDDGGGGDLALVLAAVRPGSRPESGYNIVTMVTSVTPHLSTRPQSALCWAWLASYLRSDV